jgi:hypothetical protein
MNAINFPQNQSRAQTVEHSSFDCGLISPPLHCGDEGIANEFGEMRLSRLAFRLDHGGQVVFIELFDPALNECRSGLRLQCDGVIDTSSAQWEHVTSNGLWGSDEGVLHV